MTDWPKMESKVKINNDFFLDEDFIYRRKIDRIEIHSGWTRKDYLLTLEEERTQGAF